MVEAEANEEEDYDSDDSSESDDDEDVWTIVVATRSRNTHNISWNICSLKKAKKFFMLHVSFETQESAFQKALTKGSHYESRGNGKYNWHQTTIILNKGRHYSCDIMC